MERYFREGLQDNYWVVTETDLCVLSKRHSLDIKLKIALPNISRCFHCTTNGQGWLDWRGTSLPPLLICTKQKEKVGIDMHVLALAENAWFVQ
jgi:hypothetical protein